jgi:hypothetical protein
MPRIKPEVFAVIVRVAGGEVVIEPLAGVTLSAPAPLTEAVKLTAVRLLA